MKTHKNSVLALYYTLKNRSRFVLCIQRMFSFRAVYTTNHDIMPKNRAIFHNLYYANVLVVFCTYNAMFSFCAVYTTRRVEMCIQLEDFGWFLVVYTLRMVFIALHFLHTSKIALKHVSSEKCLTDICLILATLSPLLGILFYKWGILTVFVTQVGAVVTVQMTHRMTHSLDQRGPQ